MAQPPDMCQRPSWRCYINHHNLSLSLTLLLPLSPAIISISRSLYLSHCLLCSPPPSRLVFSPPIRPLWLCQFASLLNFSQRGGSAAARLGGIRGREGGWRGWGQPDRGRKVQGRRSAFMIGSPAHRQEIDRKISAICKTIAAVKERGLVFSPPSL